MSVLWRPKRPTNLPPDGDQVGLTLELVGGLTIAIRFLRSLPLDFRPREFCLLTPQTLCHQPIAFLLTAGCLLASESANREDECSDRPETTDPRTQRAGEIRLELARFTWRARGPTSGDEPNDSSHEEANPAEE